MRAKKLLPVLVTLIFTSSALCLSQEDRPELSNTMHASCVIKIVTTNDILPQDKRALGDAIVFTLFSSNIGGKAAKETLGITPEADFWEFLDVLLISVTKNPADIYTDTVSLSIDLKNVDPAPAPAAEEFLFVLVEAFRQSLSKSYEDSKKVWAQQMSLAYENADSAEARLKNLQAEQADLRAKEGITNLSHEAILKDANNLRTQIAQEEFNLKSLDWRRDSLFGQMRFYRGKVEEEINRNNVLKELQNLVDIQTKELSTLKEKGHKDIDDQFIQAEEKLAKTKIELAQKKQQITNDAGGNKIDDLEFKLNNFEIEKAENVKRLQYLQKRLYSTEALLKQAEQYEILSLKIQVAKNALKDALYKLEEMKQQLKTMKPAVILVGSE